MGYDRFVFFDRANRMPTCEQIGIVLADYMRGIATEVEWNESGKRYYALLPGGKSYPLRRLMKELDLPDYLTATDGEERWIEVFVALDGAEPCISVITRVQDEVTMDLAGGFARRIAQYWKGRLEEG